MPSIIPLYNKSKIVPIDKKKEFYDKANALGQQEVINFAKRLIEKQSNP